MSHMVIYRGVDGKPGYHQTDDIHDAVSFVEQMRNEEGVEHARIFRLEEVVFEYRPYYRVELTDASGPMSNGLAEGEVHAQVGAGEDAEAPGDDGLEVVDTTISEEAEASAEGDDGADANGGGDNGAGENGEVKADAGAGKKGLFGR